MVRTWLLPLLVAALAATASAQPQTLFGSGPVEHGGYGAVATKFTGIDGEFALFVGGQGGWIINHRLVLGGAAYGLATEHKTDLRAWDYSRLYLAIGYGGALISYITKWDKLAHPTFDLLIGAGDVALERRWDSHDSHETIDRDAFFVMEPGAHVEVNMVSWMRVAAGVSYRYVSGVSEFGYSSADIGGVAGSLVFKFGRF